MLAPALRLARREARGGESLQVRIGVGIRVEGRVRVRAELRLRRIRRVRVRVGVRERVGVRVGVTVRVGVNAFRSTQEAFPSSSSSDIALPLTWLG